MSHHGGEDHANCSEEFLNEVFGLRLVRQRERIFGQGTLSHGGRATAEDVCTHLRLKPGHKLLDLGSANGDNAFYTARQYRANVLGIDLSKDMIALAKKNLQIQDNDIKERVRFKLCDALEEPFDESSFDAVLSRGVFMYIGEKKKIMDRLHFCLKNGGRLVITDYCIQSGELSKAIQEYITLGGVYLVSAEDYEEVLRNSGFTDIKIISDKDAFLDILKKELKNFQHCEEAFVLDFTQEEYDSYVKDWKNKIKLVTEDEFNFCIIQATCNKN